MAKISKKILKDIVKECLVEILAEGLASNKNSSVLKESKQVRPRRKQKRTNSSNLRPSLDNIKMQQPSRPKKSEIPPSVQPFIQGQDPMMAEIFADTAKNTLMEQVNAEKDRGYGARVSQGDLATREMVKSDPAELFGGSENWAALAFADSIKK